MSGILTGPAIVNALVQGGILIDPYNPDQVNPASYDLRLGDKVAVYRKQVHVSLPEWRRGYDGAHELTADARLVTSSRAGTNLTPIVNEFSCKDAHLVHEFTIDPKHGWVILPGIGYLMHTAERVCTHKYVPVLDGKSSIGRLFIDVHATAGYGDPGFDGQYTLEVTSVFPVRVYPGMRFCQMRFHVPQGELINYQTNGHYIGSASMGPVPSMAHKQFASDTLK